MVGLKWVEYVDIVFIDIVGVSWCEYIFLSLSTHCLKMGYKKTAVFRIIII